jgi:hypothetical protein
MSGNAISYGIPAYVARLKDKIGKRPIERQIAFLERKVRNPPVDEMGASLQRQIQRVIDDLRASLPPSP